MQTYNIINIYGLLVYIDHRWRFHCGVPIMVLIEIIRNYNIVIKFNGRNSLLSHRILFLQQHSY